MRWTERSLGLLATFWSASAVAGTTFEVSTDRAQFEARIGGTGAVRVVDFDDPDTAEGVGCGHLGAPCAQRGVPALGSATDVADCLAAQHACRVDRLVERQYPRAEELQWIFD